MAPSLSDDRPPASLRARWIDWRNRVLASERFQSFAAAFPLTRPIARRRAARQFDLVSGFVQSQILHAVVTGGLIDFLADGARSQSAIAAAVRLDGEALERLLKGAASIGLVEPVTPGWWALGKAGAELSRNTGAKAMIAHHGLLYRDLADPLALLRDDRATPGDLARFWDYRDDGEGAPYSALMAASQPMVHEQILAAYRFDRHRRMLDVGGGNGAFIAAVAKQAASLHFGHCDLGNVSRLAREKLAPLGERVEYHALDFHRDALPQGYDLVTLVRILHDHDDAAAQALIERAAHCLRPGGRLLIAEPLAGTGGAEAMGDAYFGFYLWAMGRGRPRRAAEYGAMLERAGFRRWKEIRTRQPIIVRLLMADR